MTKPIVKFTGTPYFFEFSPEDPVEVARVYALNHPRLGMGEVRTSVVVKKNDDGSFETLNTMYVPITDNSMTGE